MKKIFLLLIGILIAVVALCQQPLNVSQLRLLNNTDSTSKGSTTGIFRYDPITGKFRFYNALTSTWFSYSTLTRSNFSATSPLTYNNSTGVFSTSISFGKLVGRTSLGSGVMQEITANDGLVLSGGNLRFGGTFASAKSINGGGFSFTMSNLSDFGISSSGAVNIIHSATTSNLWELSSVGGFIFQTGSAFFRDYRSSGSRKGLEVFDPLTDGADYTDGSYIHRLYADGRYQPLDADLTAIAALSTDGFLKKTSGTWGMDNSTYLTGSLSSGRMPYWNGSALADAAYWDNSNTRLGIGVSPTVPLDVVGAGKFTGSLTTSGTNDFIATNGTYTGRLGVGTYGLTGIVVGSDGANSLTFATNSLSRFSISSGGVLNIVTTPSTDNTANPLAIDGSGNVVKRTNVSTLTNSAAADEIIESDGTNLRGTKLFSSSDGDLTLGNGSLAGTARSFTAAGSGSNINLEFNPKGSGGFVVNNGGAFTVNLSSGTADFALAGSFNSVTNSASTNTVINGMKISGISTGTTTNGVGTSLILATENGSGTVKNGATIESVCTDVTNTSEDFKTVHKAMLNGTSTELFTTDFSSTTPRLLFPGNGIVEATTQLYLQSSAGVVISTSTNVEIAPGSAYTTKFNGGGIYNDGSALKHIRGTLFLTTGATGTKTLTWPTAFADANYTVTCSCQDATASATAVRLVHIENVAAASVQVRLENLTAGSVTSTIHCIAMHD